MHGAETNRLSISHIRVVTASLRMVKRMDFDLEFRYGTEVSRTLTVCNRLYPGGDTDPYLPYHEDSCTWIP